MTGKHIVSKNYRSLLSVKETEKAILKIKTHFQKELSYILRLQRISAPLFVQAGLGINDLVGKKCVSFSIKDMGNTKAEVVQSLAKWKRMQLMLLDIPLDQGIYVDMNAIRPEEVLDYTHSIYVDQWDWERHISKEQRSIDFLCEMVKSIYGVVLRTEKFICYEYDNIKPILPDRITFITSQELEDKYPNISPKERENKACEKYGAVFVIGIGANLKSGQPHGRRNPDNDDWTTLTTLGQGLNGDILIWHPVVKQAYEISSMGIRVDKESLLRQLTMEKAEDRKDFYFHKFLLEEKLPLSIGGGIGQSRLCAFYLRKAHIGEVQSSIWPSHVIQECRAAGIHLL